LEISTAELESYVSKYIKTMNTLSINREWDFVANEITFSNKGGASKGKMLFEFQILLSALRKSQTSKEKQMLISIYKKQKGKYKTHER